MFEKEAEEYADGFKIPVQPKYCISKYFKDGAEFGYNEANEWHYDKNVPCGKTKTIRVIIFDNQRDPMAVFPNTQIEFINGQQEHIVAWKEIMIPKENE